MMGHDMIYCEIRDEDIFYPDECLQCKVKRCPLMRGETDERSTEWCRWCGKKKHNLTKSTLKGKEIYECKECKKHIKDKCYGCGNFSYCFDKGYYPGIISECVK